jgi:hypothetical protein
MLRLVQGSRHDSVTFVFAWVELLKLYPEFTFSKALLDSAHDVYDIYRLLNANNTEAFIDLNDRSKGHTTYSGPLTVSDDGVPVCLANLPMLNWGFNNDRCGSSGAAYYKTKVNVQTSGMFSKQVCAVLSDTKPEWD